MYLTKVTRWVLFLLSLLVVHAFLFNSRPAENVGLGDLFT